jgi:ABC-type branched-subunit amino acid transport system substrate-binding protein
MKFISVSIVFLLLAGCAGISMIERDGIYRPEIVAKINSIEAKNRSGAAQEALKEISAIPNDYFTEPEMALKDNLLGVILFGLGDYAKAASFFQKALTSAQMYDPPLASQINLNIASVYSRQGLESNALAALGQINVSVLPREKVEKYHQLRLAVVEKLGLKRDILVERVHVLGSRKNADELKSDPIFEGLFADFQEIRPEDRLNFLQQFKDQNYFVTAYLAWLDSQQLMETGRRAEAKERINWIESLPRQTSESKDLVENFQETRAKFSRVDSAAIGVILPLSGSKAAFGERSMLGLDMALRESRFGTPDVDPVIYTKDSVGSPAVGAEAVRELVEQKHVAVIIGGLFPNEATKEYLEARRYGVFFVSLSQILLPSEQKDFLLLEIPGSIEGQMAAIFSPEVLEKLGKRAAIFYSRNQSGETYLENFWKFSQVAGVEVTAIGSYEKDEKDLRAPLKKFLGIAFPRERQEELALLGSVYSLEKFQKIRRIQTLSPQVDFDWVFLPGSPDEAIQIIPAFGYFDALAVNFIGGQSWRSDALMRQGFKWANVYFVGDEASSVQDDFQKRFHSVFKSYPRIIELISFDGMNIILSLLKEGSLASREELEAKLQVHSSFAGVTGTWQLKNGLWHKGLSLMRVRSDRIEKISECVRPGVPLFETQAENTRVSR